MRVFLWIVSIGVYCSLVSNNILERRLLERQQLDQNVRDVDLDENDREFQSEILTIFLESKVFKRLNFVGFVYSCCSSNNYECK